MFHQCHILDMWNICKKIIKNKSTVRNKSAATKMQEKLKNIFFNIILISLAFIKIISYI